VGLPKDAYLSGRPEQFKEMQKEALPTKCNPGTLLET